MLERQQRNLHSIFRLTRTNQDCWIDSQNGFGDISRSLSGRLRTGAAPITMTIRCLKSQQPSLAAPKLGAPPIVLWTPPPPTASCAPGRLHNVAPGPFTSLDSVDGVNATDYMARSTTPAASIGEIFGLVSQSEPA